MEQIQTGQGSTSVEMGNEEMMLRQKYLRQENETREQREERKANVRKLLADARETTIGVKQTSVVSAFNKGRGAE